METTSIPKEDLDRFSKMTRAQLIREYRFYQKIFFFTKRAAAKETDADLSNMKSQLVRIKEAIRYLYAKIKSK